MSLKHLLRAGATALIALGLSTTIAFAQDHDHDRHDDDRWHDHYDDHGRDHDRDHGHDHEHEHARHEHYADHDRDIHDWYRAHYNHLPPGWAKHDRLPPEMERQLIVNGTLPVVLQRRMQPCPHELEVMLPPPPPNYVHVVIGGNLVLYNRANFQVADVFHVSLN
ncbi:MAG: hypothetical protein WA485_08315 [Candidatus Sulfotelmatobacter sp.]